MFVWTYSLVPSYSDQLKGLDFVSTEYYPFPQDRDITVSQGLNYRLAHCKKTNYKYDNKIW